jgi:hypothetical protein
MRACMANAFAVGLDAALNDEEINMLMRILTMHGFVDASKAPRQDRSNSDGILVVAIRVEDGGR